MKKFLTKLVKSKTSRMWLVLSIFAFIFLITVAYIPEIQAGGDYEQGALATASKIDRGIQEGIFWVLAHIIYWIILAFGKLLIFLIAILTVIIGYNHFIHEQVVVIGWTIVRDIMNLTFIIAMMIIAFATVFKVQAYHYKQMLPRLIIAALVVNFSKMITGIFIDIAQVVTMTFVNATDKTLSGNFAQLLGIEKMLNFSMDSETSLAAGMGGLFAALVLGLVLMIVAIAVVVVMIVIMVTRIIMLWMLTILSPIVWVAPLFPGGQKYAAQWWEQLTKQLVIGAVVAFFLWLTFASLQISHNLGTIPESDLTNAGSDFGFATQIGSVENMWSFVVGIAMLAGALMVAQQIGGIAGNFAGKMSGLLQAGGALPGKLGGKLGWSMTKWGGRRLNEGAMWAQKKFLKGNIPGTKWLADRMTGKKKRDEAKEEIRKKKESRGGTAADAFATLSQEQQNILGTAMQTVLAGHGGNNEAALEEIENKRAEFGDRKSAEEDLANLNKLKNLYDIVENGGTLTDREEVEKTRLENLSGLTDSRYIDDAISGAKDNVSRFDSLDQLEKMIKNIQEGGGISDVMQDMEDKGIKDDVRDIMNNNGIIELQGMDSLEGALARLESALGEVTSKRGVAQSRYDDMKRLKELKSKEALGTIKPEETSEMTELFDNQDLLDYGVANGITFNSGIDDSDLNTLIGKAESEMRAQDQDMHVLQKAKGMFTEAEGKFVSDASRKTEKNRFQYAFSRIANEGLTLNPVDLMEGFKAMRDRRLKEEKVGHKEGVHDVASALWAINDSQSERKTEETFARMSAVNERAKEMMEKTNGETDQMVAEYINAVKSGNREDIAAATELLAKNVDWNETVKGSAADKIVPYMREALASFKVEDKTLSGPDKTRLLTSTEVEKALSDWRENGEVAHPYMHQLYDYNLMKAFGGNENSAAQFATRVGIGALSAGNPWAYGNSGYNANAGQYQFNRQVVRMHADGTIKLEMSGNSSGSQSGKLQNISWRAMSRQFHFNNMANEDRNGNARGMSSFGEVFLTRNLDGAILENMNRYFSEWRKDLNKLAISQEFMEDAEKLASDLERGGEKYREFLEKGYIRSRQEARMQAKFIRAFKELLKQKTGRSGGVISPLTVEVLNQTGQY